MGVAVGFDRVSVRQYVNAHAEDAIPARLCDSSQSTTASTTGNTTQPATPSRSFVTYPSWRIITS
jgi:hypothetical protein